MITYTPSKRSMGDADRLRRLRERLPVTPEEEATVRSFFESDPEFELWPDQVGMLVEAWRNGGLLAKAAVGAGKTLVTACLPTVFGRTGAESVLFVPASLVSKTKAELAVLQDRFNIDPPQMILSYAAISRDKSKAWEDFLALAPKAIIFDEAHLMSPTGRRGKRLREYILKHECNVAALSGTFDRKSLGLMAEVGRVTLGLQSPLPLDRLTILYMEAIVGGGRGRSQDYVLSVRARRFIERWLGSLPPVGHEQVAMQRLGHFVGSRAGVYVASDEFSGPLTVSAFVYDSWPSETIRKAQTAAGEFWEDPDGNMVCGPAQVADLKAQLQQGFFYRQVWPEGTDPEYVRGYREARRRWASAVHQYVQHGGRFDSESVARKAIRSGILRHPGLVDAYRQWQPFDEGPKPKSEDVWLDDGLMRRLRDDCAARTARGCPTLVWFHHTAPIRWLAANEVPGVVAVPSGKPFPAPGTSCWATMKGHGTGRNLQAWAHNLIISYQATEYLHQQTIGRTHRHGQESHVEVEYYIGGPFKRVFQQLVQRTREAEKKSGEKWKLTNFLARIPD